MLHKTIPYTDWDGKAKTKTFWFNISKAEMAELELTHQTGSYRDHLKQMGESDNKKAIFGAFKELLALSVGWRDGDNFVKSEKISQDFMYSGAYDEFLLELVAVPGVALEFFEGVFPSASKLESDMAKYQPKTQTVDLPPLVPVTKENVSVTEARPKEAIFGDGDKADGRLMNEYTQAELTSMTRAEFEAVMARSQRL